MITLEVARKLKEAKWNEGCNPRDCGWAEPNGDGEWLPFPSLEELINACVKFNTGFSVHFFEKQGTWMVRNWYNSPQYANDLHEAVALLYIEISKDIRTN